MATVTVEVEVDLDKIDLNDLIETFLEKFERFKERRLSNKETKAFEENLQAIKAAIADNPAFEIATLDDTFKMEHLKRVFDKYTAAHIESVLP